MLKRTFVGVLVVLSIFLSFNVSAKVKQGKTEVLLRYISVWSATGHKINDDAAMLECDNEFDQAYHLNPQVSVIDFKSTYRVNMATRMMKATADFAGLHFDLNTLGTSPTYNAPIQFRYDDSQYHVFYSVKLSDESVKAWISMDSLKNNNTCVLSSDAN